MAQNTLIYRFKNLIPEQTTSRHIIIKLFKNKGKKQSYHRKETHYIQGKKNTNDLIRINGDLKTMEQHL